MNVRSWGPALLLFSGSQTPRETAQRVAAVLFCALLGSLAFGWWRARERAVRDEADLVLEREFLQLEREIHAEVEQPGAAAISTTSAPPVPGFPRVERKG